MISRSRRVALVVFVVFAIVAMSAFVLAQRVVHQEESRLLAERTAEVGAQLTNSAISTDTSLRSLGTLAPLPEAKTAFPVAATPLLTGLVRTIALISRGNSGFSVQTVVGDRSSLGPTFSPERTALLERAFT